MIWVLDSGGLCFEKGRVGEMGSERPHYIRCLCSYSVSLLQPAVAGSL